MAYLAGLHAAGQVKAFRQAHQRTAQVQQQLLRTLLAAHAQTQFGRDHDFSKIADYRDFRAAVPIGSYESLEPYIQRVLDGQSDALLPASERAMMFSMTSGTTGKPKHIPVTPRFAREMRRGSNIYGLMVLGDHPEAWLRPILQISSPMREHDSPTGLPCGAISGMLAETQKRIVRQMYVVPPEVLQVQDPLARYYTTLRCGVHRDVSILVTANPSSTIKMMEIGQAHAERLIRDVADGTLNPPGTVGPEIRKAVRFKPNRALARRMEQGLTRDGRLLPRHFWSVAFLCNWTGGTLQLYLPRLRELFGDVPVRDIGLLASEGRFSVPLADGTPAGVAEITANFLEFIPVEEAASSDPQPLLAHELEIGREYFLVFTNWASLWRYNLDDRIRVVDRLGQSPIFEFLSRGMHTASITGEKITEHQVVEAMRQACAKLNRQAPGDQSVTVERFCLQGRFAAIPYYELRADTHTDRAEKLSELMEAALCDLNIEYASKRKSGRLGPIRPIVLPAGTLDDHERQRILDRRGRSEQYKHQYLLTEVLRDEA